MDEQRAFGVQRCESVLEFLRPLFPGYEGIHRLLHGYEYDGLYARRDAERDAAVRRRSRFCAKSKQSAGSLRKITLCGKRRLGRCGDSQKRGAGHPGNFEDEDINSVIRCLIRCHLTNSQFSILIRGSRASDENWELSIDQMAPN